MVDGVKCGTHVEKSQKSEPRPIDSPINVREEAQEEGLGGDCMVESLLHDYIPTRVLRSSDQHLLENPKSSTAKASRAFRHSAPVVWNSLSANTRCATSPGSFKQLLKTELLRLHSAANLFFLCIRVILTDESLHVKPTV